MGMNLYRAIILLMTCGMVILHLFEWRAVPSILQGVGGCAARARIGQRLRLAVHFEAFYYLAACPILYAASNTSTGRVLMIFAVYHWVGLALLEVTGFWRKNNARALTMGARRMVTWSIAMFDLAEVAVLALLARGLYASVFAVVPLLQSQKFRAEKCILAGKGHSWRARQRIANTRERLERRAAQ